jgi:hypothetical protein
VSDLAIFIVGSIIFAITVYGAVMVGGLRLTREQIEQNDLLEPEGDDSVAATIPLDVKY